VKLKLIKVLKIKNKRWKLKNKNKHHSEKRARLGTEHEVF
jgi:hypothetical protein